MSARPQTRRPPVAACRAIEIIEAQSALSQHRCAPVEEAKRLGLASFRMGSATAVLTRNSKNLIYNCLKALGQASPATPGQLDRFTELARAHRVRAIAVSVGDAARPRCLTDWLGQRGFQRGHPAAKLWRHGATLPRHAAVGPARDRLRVRRVRPAEAPIWVDVVARVWRSFAYRRPWFEARAAAPGWRHYLAWIGDQPVAAAAMYVGATGTAGSPTVGHLVDGVTLKPWRRRGAQGALIRRRITDGRALGCRLFTSETAPPLPRMPLVSFRNLRRQGFELAYLRHSWKLTLRS